MQFRDAESIKNNGLALLGLYAELQRPKIPKNVIVKYIIAYIISLMAQNATYYKPKIGRKNKLQYGFCLSSLAQIDKKLLIF